MSVAHYGEPFVTAQVTDVDLGDEVYVGLLACSHEDDVIEKVTYRDVRLVVPMNRKFDYQRDVLRSHLELLDVATGHRRIIYSVDTIFEAPNWTRDGQALIYNSGGRLYRFDLATKTPSLINTDDVIRNNNDHVLSFDGTMLAISSHSGEENTSLVYTVPVQGGKPKLITPTGPSYLHGWSPDGKFLVYTGLRHGDYDIYRVSIDAGEETQLTTAIGLDDGPEYTPDGKYIYFNSVRSGRMQIWRMKPDGSDQEQLTDDEYNNWFPHISPDGKWVIFITYILYNSLGTPIMMTNLYPFLMGQAALKHERIPDFPEVDEPENHILVAHCGYLGVLPQSFSTEWTLRPKVLAIVDDNATVIDARLPAGPVTLAKLDPTFNKITATEGSLTGYAQYPNSDCLNGGVIKVSNGHKLMNTLSSHHSLLMTGHKLADIELLAKIFDLDIEEI